METRNTCAKREATSNEKRLSIKRNQWKMRQRKEGFDTIKENKHNEHFKEEKNGTPWNKQEVA